MKRFKRKRRKIKQRKIQINPIFILVVLSVFSVISIITSLQQPNSVNLLQQTVSTVVVPIQKGLNKIGFDFKSNSISKTELLEQENEFLKTQIQELEAENFKYKKGQAELKRLRKLHQLKDKYDEYDTALAKVIGKSESNWFSTFIIDKGTEDGLKKNMNVVGYEGLIGYISEVYSDYAKVTTIIDESSGISGEFLDANVLCMVHGDMQQIQTGTLPISNIDSEAEIEKGDVIVTSQISSKYHPGLKIGISGEAFMDDSSLSKIATVTPAIDFKNIHEVMIITTMKEEQ